MHHESGSALQKVTFVLVLFVAAAAGYLVVRERLRADQQRADAAAAQVRVQEAEISKAVTAFNSNRTATNSVTYAPLRDRVMTNTVRVPSNRFIAVSNVNIPSAPPVVLVGESQPYTRNTAHPVVVGLSSVFPGGGRSGGASVTGRVFLRGTPPPEKVVTLDAASAQLHPAPMTTRHYVTGPGGTLADVFVYVKQGAEPQPVARSAPSPLLEQVNAEYVPYVIGVQAGQVLKVRNSDPLLHNVHVLTKVPGNKERNVGMPGKGFTSDFVFEKPEVFVQFKCDVHPWEFAYVGVVDHPWFAVTDRKGEFTLPPGLPAGQYTLAAVHRKAGEQTQTITVGANGSAPVTFTLEVPGP